MSGKEEKPVHGVPGLPRRMMLTALVTGVGLAVAACGRLGFSFRSKGSTEISASNASQGPDCELPTS